MLSFFQSTVKVEILILGNANIQVKNNGHIICEGKKEECMNKLRREVYNLQGLGKTVLINVNPWTARASNPKLVADAVCFFRNHLTMLKSSTRCDIHTNFRRVPDAFHNAVSGAGYIN